MRDRHLQGSSTHACVSALVLTEVCACFPVVSLCTQVCEDWFSRTRESLLWLSAAAGAHQHMLFHGMARLQELQAQLKALTAHSQAQQQLLQQERDKQKARQQEGSATAAAAVAAAAAAISGLGTGPQQQERGRERQLPQQQQAHEPPSRGADAGTEQRKLKGRHNAAQAANDPQQPSSGSASTSPGSSMPSVSEQMRMLQQQYQAALLQLAAPVLSTLVLLADACVAAREPHVVLGLQQWCHRGFHAVWDAVSQLYSLDLLATADDYSGQAVDELGDLDGYLSIGGSAAAAGAPGQHSASEKGVQQQQQQHAAAPSSMLLLSWLPAAAAQAAGRYEEALLHYRSFVSSEAASTGLGAACRAWLQEQMAACYAAIADWEGLVQLSTAQRQQQPLPQQQADPQLDAIPWVQHWQFAGTAGVKHLQDWGEAAAGPAQHNGMGLQTIEQHLGAHGRGSRGDRAGRGRGSHHADRGHGPHGNLPHLLRLDLPGRCVTSVSPATLAVLRATAALEVCCKGGVGSSSDSNTLEGLGEFQQRLSARGVAGRGPGRGRHSAAGQSQQHHAAVMLDPEQQQRVLAEALQEVQQQVEALQRNPYVICLALSSGMDRTSHGRCNGSTLPLLQLLQQQLAAALDPQQQHGQHAVQSIEQLVQLLSSLPATSSRCGSSSTAPDAVWSTGLRQDGQLTSSVFGDVASATSLLQVGPQLCWHALPCVVYSQYQH